MDASTTKQVSEATESNKLPPWSYFPSFLSFLINQQLSGPSQMHDQSLVRRGRKVVAKTRAYFASFEDHVSSQLGQRVGVTISNLILPLALLPKTL